MPSVLSVAMMVPAGLTTKHGAAGQELSGVFHAKLRPRAWPPDRSQAHDAAVVGARYDGASARVDGHLGPAAGLGDEVCTIEPDDTSHTRMSPSREPPTTLLPSGVNCRVAIQVAAGTALRGLVRPGQQVEQRQRGGLGGSDGPLRPMAACRPSGESAKRPPIGNWRVIRPVRVIPEIGRPCSAEVTRVPLGVNATCASA